VTFFLGDSRVFGDFGDLAFGDSLFFFGDLVVLAFAALAFLGDVANFLGLVVVVVFFVDVVEGFLVVAFFGDEVVDGFLVVVLAFVVDFLGVIDVFLELVVDLFLGDEGTVRDPEVDCVEVVVDFFVVVFFFLSFDTAPGISLYDALTLWNKTPSFRLREILTCLRAVS